MKKFDLIIISIVLLISIGFYAVFFDVFRLDEDVVVEITYENLIIYQVNYHEDMNVTVEITSKNKVLTVSDGSKTSHFNIRTNVEIVNTVLITGKEIHMTVANCENKYCLQMHLSKNYPLPIVCTNGVMIKLKTDEPRWVVG